MTAHEAAALSSVGSAGLHEGWRAFVFNQPKNVLFVTVGDLCGDDTLWSIASCGDRDLLHQDGWEPLDDEAVVQ
jgi:hypothetical protein